MDLLINNCDKIEANNEPPKKIRKDRIRYDYDFLIDFCDKNNLKLIVDYKNERVNRDTKIKAQCINCDNVMVEKAFRELVKRKNFGCIDCSKIIAKERLISTNIKTYGCESIFQNKEIRDKIKNTNIKLYGVENPTQNKNIIKKMQQTNIARYGHANVSQNSKIREKIKNTIKKRYNCDHALQHPNFKRKMEQTNMKRYGFVHVMKNKKIKAMAEATNLKRYGFKHTVENPIIKEKIRNSNIKRYGYTNAMKNKKIREKVEATNLLRYGYKNATENEKVKNKIKETFLKNNVKEKIIATNLLKYGCKYGLQAEEIKRKIKETYIKNNVREKIIATNLLRYGYTHAMKNKFYAEKSLKNALKRKKYTFSSGRVDSVQGYENFGLDFLLKIENINEYDIITSRLYVPEIWWKDSLGKEHRYYIDIFIPLQKRGIEIKSTWTFEKDMENVLLKQQAFIDAGYTCEIWIFDKKGKRIKTC